MMELRGGMVIVLPPEVMVLTASLGLLEFSSDTDFGVGFISGGACGGAILGGGGGGGNKSKRNSGLLEFSSDTDSGVIFFFGEGGGGRGTGFSIS